MSGAIVFRPITPSKKFNTAAVRDAIDSEIEAVANDMLLDFELTTATWEQDVKFEKMIEVKKDRQEIFVGTDNKIYRFVDKGTKRHKIRPKKAGGTLAFPSMFIPKTSPGKMVASFGQSGGDTLFAKEVNHPGTKPRKFSKNIQKKWIKLFPKRMDKAMKRAVEASGHAYK
jgi:hypothetical protein